MTPRKETVYFLTDKSNLFYSLEDGAITKNAVPKPINDNPIGANDLQLAFGTNNKYWSLNRSFTVPLTFVNDGCDILRFLVYNGKGYEETVYLTILQLNPETGVYELLFKGKIDFTKLKDDPTTGVTVNVIEGGLLSYLNANDGVTYEIPCNAKNTDCIKVKFDGTVLLDRLKFSVLELPLDLNKAVLCTIPVTYLSNEGDTVGFIHGNPEFEDLNSNIFSSDQFNSPELSTYVQNSANYLFSSATATTINISGQISFSNTNNRVQIFIKSSLLNGKILYSNQPLGGADTISFNETFTLVPDEKYFLIAYFLEKIDFKESFIYLSTETKNPPSTCYALEPLKLGKSLLSKMTEGQYTMESNFFTAHNNIVAAGGESIRGIIDAVLKTSFQDFYNSYNAIYNLGVKVVDNVLWIEPKKDLYNDSSDILDMGEVSQFSIGYAEEYLVNTVKIGYPVQDYGERNGRFEFNDTIEEKLPVTAVNKELNLVSKYRGDSYGIEFNRGKLNNKDSTDNKGDNEVFLINVDASVISQNVSLSLSKSPQTSVSGSIHFDDVTLATGGVEDFISYSSKVNFTYTNDVTQRARISFFAYGSNPNQGGAFIITVNGNEVASDFVQDYQTTFRSSISQEVKINNGDVISVTCSMIVDISSAGLEIDIIQVNAVETYGLKRVTYDTLTGVPTPTVYNVEEMTPYRMFMNWWDYFASLLYQLKTEKVTFQTADKNKELSTTYNGLTITEKTDTLVSLMGDPLFLPFEISFTTKVPFAFAKIMSRLTAGDIKITYNNFPIYLLPIGDMKCKPVSDEAQEWKLLASPLNSLDTLLKLSQGAIIIQDYMNNQVIISDLNPVHFVRYDCVQTADRTFVKAAIPPTGNQGLVAGVQSRIWNCNGAKVFAPNFPLNGDGSMIAHLITPHFWVNGDEAIDYTGSPTSNVQDSRMNKNGVWVQDNTTVGTIWLPIQEWIGFSRKVVVAPNKTVYIGIAGDNYVRLNVNGVEILNTTNSADPRGAYVSWNIYPVLLPLAVNYIEMFVMNGATVDPSNPAGFACEIYDMTLNQLLTASTESDLNIIFRTKDMIGQPFDIGTTIGYSCEDGWVLQKDDATNAYSCVKTIKGNDCSDHHELNKRYHFKGIYDDRFQNRLDRYDSKAKYYQKWQINDFVNLQFITVGYGAVQLEIYDCQTNQIAIIKANVVADTSLQSPYIKQEFSLDLSQFGTGVYQYVISINGVKLLISEWQQVSTDLSDTLLIEYYNTSNKPDAYFKTWRPCLRIEAFMPAPTPESTSTTYEDQPGDTEILSGTAWMKQKFILGDGYGVPDYIAKKLNRLLLLNRVYMDGTEYTKAGDAKLETVELVEGYPMNYYTVEMRESINAEGLVISDVDIKNSFASTLTLDAEAFGGAPGTIQIDID